MNSSAYNMNPSERFAPKKLALTQVTGILNQIHCPRATLLIIKCVQEDFLKFLGIVWEIKNIRKDVHHRRHYVVA